MKRKILSFLLAFVLCFWGRPLSVPAADNKDAPFELELNQEIRATLGAEKDQLLSKHYYVFTLTQPSRVTVQASKCTGFAGFYAAIGVYGNSQYMGELRSHYPGADGLDNPTSWVYEGRLPAGMYYVVISNWADWGEYALKVTAQGEGLRDDVEREYNNTPETANSIELGRTYYGNLSTGYFPQSVSTQRIEEDWYRVGVARAGNLQITFTGAWDERSYVWIYQDPEKNYMQWMKPGAGETMTSKIHPVLPGDYYIVVTKNNENYKTSGDYSFRVDLLEETTPAAPPETTPAAPPETSPAAPPETSPAAPPETTPAAPPETTPAAPPAAPPETTSAAPPETTQAAPPETTSAVPPETASKTPPKTEANQDSFDIKIGTYICYRDSYGYTYDSAYRPTLKIERSKRFTLTINTGSGMKTCTGTWSTIGEAEGSAPYVILNVTTANWSDSRTYAFSPLSNGGLCNEDGYLGITPTESEFQFKRSSGSSSSGSYGWQEEDGEWYWYTGGESYAQNRWIQSQGVWYWLGGNGAMYANRWLNTGGSWYYLSGSGAMAKGWLYLGGTWYYLDPGSGAMYANRWLYTGGAWYYLTGSGAMAKGWLNLGGTWYYLDPGSGAMYSNTYTPDGYYVNASGAWV